LCTLNILLTYIHNLEHKPRVYSSGRLPAMSSGTINPAATGYSAHSSQLTFTVFVPLVLVCLSACRLSIATAAQSKVWPVLSGAILLRCTCKLAEVPLRPRTSNGGQRGETKPEIEALVTRIRTHNDQYNIYIFIHQMLVAG